MRPLLSIVVPTKNRYKYLKHLISLIDSFSSSDIELIIQDNTENNREILEFISQKKYPYLKYFHNKEQLPISYNSDLAILNSTGEYVCFIGDDDGVTRHIADCVHWMKENDVDALTSSYSHYKWPDFVSNTHNISGTLNHKNFTKKTIEINAQEALYRLLKNGFKDLEDIPKVYHGIVKREVLDKIFKIGGTFFPGPSPDMANAVALCFVVDKFVSVDFPVIIGGASKTVGGGIKKYKNLVANIEDQPFLPKNSKENWEQSIPKVWASETVWPESAIKALRYMKKEYLFEKINYDHILAYFIVYHIQLWEMAIKLSRNKIKLLVLVVILLVKRYFKAFKRLVILKLFGKLNGMNIIYNLNDIEQAQSYLINVEPSFKLKDLE